MTDQNPVDSGAPKHRNLLVLLFAGFVLSGIATTIIGPMLPVFISRWSLDDSHAGLFSTVQFLSALAGTLASGILSWRGYRPTLVLGYALMGGGLAAFNSDTHRVALEATTVFGFGYGLITPGTNLFVAELAGAKSASLLNQLNFSWGVGAMMCSPLIAFALKHNTLAGMLTGFAVFGGLLVVGLLVTPFGAQHHQENRQAGDTKRPSVALWVTIALAALFFIYVATENGIGIWAAEYAKRIAHGLTALTTLAPMFFYAGLTLGRVCAPFILRLVSELKIVVAALLLTAAGTALLIVAPALLVALLAVFLVGLGCASIYPIFIAWLSRWHGARAKRIGGILFALGSLGGAAGPGMIGFISKHSASLRIGLLAPLAATVAMLGIVLLLRKQAAA
ncbi:MAG TPA: MFS transporter [Candidatus Angelobacter sp.]|nr:MFS transporter [Candidatus Angelobacter sp.]